MLSSRSSIRVRSVVGRAVQRSAVTTIPKFPYGVESYSFVVEQGLFFADKSSYIRKLEQAGYHLKIWRPRRFGKTMVCGMLREYYDAANSKAKMLALFGKNDIMKDDQITDDMGKYLVLSFSFANVSPDGDVEANFRAHINNTVDAFSEKYYDAGLLKRPVVIDHNNALSSLDRLFKLVNLSGQKIYLIVDECDSFVNRLLLSVDTTNPELSWNQYQAIVAGTESLLRNWGNVIKAGTGDAIERSFFTGVVPQVFVDGLSGLNMVDDITFDSDFAGLFGLTSKDVWNGLSQIQFLTEQQRIYYRDKMKEHYDGFRFVKDQKTEAMYNPQYVLYYLRHLDRKGVPPASIIDRAVNNSIDNVAQYLIQNHRAGAAYTLQNFLMGTFKPEEIGTFTRDVPAFLSLDLFKPQRVGDCLISLAFYHGFLTFKSDEQGRTVLTSPNQISKTLYAESLFAELPNHFLEQLMVYIRSSKPEDLEAIKQKLTTLSLESCVKGFATAVGGGLGEASVAEGLRVAETAKQLVVLLFGEAHDHAWVRRMMKIS